MKTIQTWLTMIALLLCSISASAHDFEVDGIYYNILSAADRTVEVTKPESTFYGGNIIIPSIVNFHNIEFTVTQIGNAAFSNGADNNTELTSVALPSTLVAIGDYAFQYCDNIKRITIPEGVTSIQEGTFNSCCNLEEVKLSPKTKSIGDYAFYGCSRLKPFDFPETLQSIGCGALQNCESFTYAKLHTTTGISVAAFYNSVKIISLPPWGTWYIEPGEIFNLDDVIFIVPYEEMYFDWLESYAPSYKDYVASLKMVVDIHATKYHELSRISELTQRTNKCTNGMRYTLDELKDRFSSDNYKLYTICLSDKFSDLGIVGAVGLQEDCVELFSLSCRALGRGVEDKTILMTKDMGVNKIKFEDTGKNAALLHLMKLNGFILSN